MLFGLFKKKAVKSKTNAGQSRGELVGEISHYFAHCKAGVIKLKSPIAPGDTIEIKGHTTNFKQKIDSLQINNQPVQSAKAGEEAGFLAKKRVRSGDKVYKI
ncbi:MAG: translation elongation factor-like protein [Candidatus Omnitrophica bacterium]|nr:translation elongation factor-like protein [Candidatus Omnitrophota bacterium]